MGNTNVFTYTLNGGSLSINASQNVLQLSFLCTAGNVTCLGNARFNGLTSTPNQFSAGQGATLQAQNPLVPLSNVVITAPTGDDYCDIMILFQ